jgi:long-chain fatty acid transport protein
MKKRSRKRVRQIALWAALLVGLWTLPAMAGGLLLYEVGTADVGLASAGYGARAQDASTVLTNPAGMTRLPGAQLLFGAQALYGDYQFTIDPGTSPALGAGDGGNTIGWFPGGSAFFTYRVSPRLAVGLGAAGNFGLAEKYDPDWVGRYYVQEATLLGVSVLPSIAYRVTDTISLGATLNAVYGVLKNQVAINNITGGDGQLALEDKEWGFGFNVGLLYEPGPGTRVGLVYNSQVDLDFQAPAKFSGLAPALDNLLTSRGLKDAAIGLGVKVPQGVMASVFHQVDDKWAVLGSVGWQQWSKFGKVEFGISDTSTPTSLTKDLEYDDTWHAALGAQYRIREPWRLDFGAAYDSGIQNGSNVSPMLPVNDAWRFGVGAQNQYSKTFLWGFAAEYTYGGTLDVEKRSTLPVGLGGRGDLVGSYKDTGIFFITAYLSKTF